MTSRRIRLWLAAGLFVATAPLLAIGALTAWDSRGADKLVPECRGPRATDFSCLDRRYRALVRAAGVQAALADLRRQSQRSQAVRVTCHQLAHTIGRAAAERSPDPAAPFAQGDSSCEAGYYHGVVQAVAAKLGAQAFLDGLESTCASVRSGAARRLYVECVHGLGHGVMSVLGNRLYAALPACDRLPVRQDQHRCQSGVFMENIASDHGLTHSGTRYQSEDRPLYPCTDVATRYKWECYPQQATYAVRRLGDDYPSVFALCAGVKAPNDRRCYQGLGAAAADESTTDSLMLAGQIAEVAQLCRLGADREAVSNCIVGGVRGFSFYVGAASADRFCHFLEPALEHGCLREGKRYRRKLRLRPAAVEGAP